MANTLFKHLKTDNFGAVDFGLGPYNSWCYFDSAKPWRTFTGPLETGAGAFARPVSFSPRWSGWLVAESNVDVVFKVGIGKQQISDFAVDWSYHSMQPLKIFSFSLSTLQSTPPSTCERFGSTPPAGRYRSRIRDPGEVLQRAAPSAACQGRTPEVDRPCAAGCMSARVQESKLGGCQDLQSLQPTHPQPDLQLRDLLRAPSVGAWA